MNAKPIRIRSVVPAFAIALLAVTAGCAKETAAPGAGTGSTQPGATAGSSSTTGTAAPPTTAWAGAPNPCSLLTDTEIRAVTHFEINTERLDSRGPDNGMLPNCVSTNQSGRKGGYVAVTLFPPGSAALRDRSQLNGIEELPGVGQQALIAHNNKGIGAGTNIALVDMGNGGFLISAQVYSDVTPDQMKALVAAAAGRWHPA